jgi:hypothetical protein
MNIKHEVKKYYKSQVEKVTLPVHSILKERPTEPHPETTYKLNFFDIFGYSFVVGMTIVFIGLSTSYKTSLAGTISKAYKYNSYEYSFNKSLISFNRYIIKSKIFTKGE